MQEINHECYVSLEVAKLLKEEGFDWKCNGVFLSEYGTQYAFIKSDAVCDNNNSKYNPYNISAPTLEVAQRWLREVKNVEICIDWEIEFEEKELDWNKRRYCYDIDTHVDNIPLLSIDDDYWAEGYHTFGDSYSTYEEAQEAGIKKALELILEEEK